MYQNTLKHKCIVEFSLANANGEWIVPKASINHGMTIGEYASMLCSVDLSHQPSSSKVQRWLDFGLTMAVLRKAYGAGDWGLQTPALTWAKIAQLIETYVQVLPIHINQRFCI